MPPWLLTERSEVKRKEVPCANTACFAVNYFLLVKRNFLLIQSHFIQSFCKTHSNILEKQAKMDSRLLGNEEQDGQVVSTLAKVKRLDSRLRGNEGGAGMTMWAEYDNGRELLAARREEQPWLFLRRPKETEWSQALWLQSFCSLTIVLIRRGGNFEN